MGRERRDLAPVMVEEMAERILRWCDLMVLLMEVEYSL
jgi:hypothetical protein